MNSYAGHYSNNMKDKEDRKTAACDVDAKGRDTGEFYECSSLSRIRVRIARHLYQCVQRSGDEPADMAEIVDGLI